MDYGELAFWFLVLNCVMGLALALTRFRFLARGLVFVYLAILAVAVGGWLAGRNAWIYSALVLWFLFIVAPGLIALKFQRLSLQQRYPAARRLAAIISFLNPWGGWRQQQETLRAMELAQAGDQAAAMEILHRLGQPGSQTALSARCLFFRITGRWEDFLVWEAAQLPRLNQLPYFLPHRLRAHGETGNLPGLIQLFLQNRQPIARVISAVDRDMCHLMLFAFCGRPESVGKLFRGRLALLPGAFREFWVATAELTGGKPESGRRRLEELLPSADPSLRRAIERRLATPLPPAIQEPALERILEQVESEQSQEQRFGAAPKFKTARATQLMLVLNLIMFGVEILSGGSTDEGTLYYLGALFVPDVRAGEWWRMGTAMFLHYGALHLTMNMLALAVLGPLTEVALGFRRFLIVYLVAGLGSMLVVVSVASGEAANQMLVGASGSVMGLIGATGALMLRGWRRERAMAARRRLVSVTIMLAVQVVFDSLVPQVSGTAHLSGALIGFGVTLLLRDRLIPKAVRAEA